MVGFGSSLRIAKRSGWERAYLDYETLKLLLSQIEAVYEEEGHRRDNSPRTGSGGNRRRHKRGPGDYRDELFLESDSDLAFASSDYDVFGEESSSSEEQTGEMVEQGRAAQNPGSTSQAKPFTLTYSQEDVSSSEGYDEEYDGGIGECAGGTLTRAWRRGDKNAVIAKKPKKKRRSRDDGATDFFVGGDFLVGEGNDSQTEENADIQTQQSYSSSLLNTSFQRGSYSTEQTSLLQQSQSSTSQTASFYSFPTGAESSMTPPRDYFGGSNYAQTQVSWMKLGTHVETFPKTAASNPQPPRPPQTKAEIRQNKRDEERRRQRRQRRRRRLAKRRKIMEQRVPRHLRVAHGKARAITERFLGLLRAEVEKVTLFAQSRLGELADTAGSLRFPSYDDSEYGGSLSDSFHLNRPSRAYDVLSDGGMHPSASSSDEEQMGGGRGIFPWTDTSSEEEMSEGGKNPVSPSYVRKMRKSTSAGGVSVATEHRTNLSAHGKNDKKKGNNQRKGEKGSHKRARTERSNKTLDSAQRQIAHFEEIRQSRPIFQRNDHIVGEDLLLLSAVDETDGYTAVGVELMHVLRFIAINVIAVRKICRKHDRLLANRMLGGYYHRKQRKDLSNKARNRHSDKEEDPVTLGGILSTSVGVDAESELSPGERRERNKLVGVFDTKIQNLANSTTVQVISSCLALALSEYEVSHSRANALARLNSSSNIAETPQRRNNTDNERSESQTVPFGFSPSRWVSKTEKPMQRDEPALDTAAYLGSGDEDGGPPSTASSVSLTRLRFTVVSVFALREAARSKEDTYTSYLSRASLVIPGPVVEGLDGCSRETLDFFVAYNPDAALLLNSFSLYKGLDEGQWRDCPIMSVMLSALATASSATQPISNAEYVAEPDDTDLVMNALSMTADSDGLAYLDPLVERSAKGRSSSHARRDVECWTLRLNCTSLLLYTMNYYIILPSANSFVVSTGAHAPYSAALIGATSFAAIFSNMFHSFLLSRKAERKKPHVFGLSFFRLPLILSSFFPIIGNVVYVLACYRNSIPMAVGGRLIVGLGSAEILHRLLLIAHYLPDVSVVAESARLVKSQVKGLVISLFVGALLEAFDVNMFLFGHHIYVPTYASSSGLMVVLWFVQWTRLCFLFHEPGETTPASSKDQEPLVARDPDEAFNASSSDSDSSMENNSGTPESIFFRSSSEGTRDELEAAYGSNPMLSTPPIQMKGNKKEDKEPRNDSIRRSTGKPRRKRGLKTFAGRLLHVLTYNVSLPVTFVLIFLVKFSHEILFTSCALIMRRYFDWGGSIAGLFLGSLTALVLPIHYFCEKLSRIFEERTVVKRSLVIVTVGLLVMVNWGSMFYLFSRAENLMTEGPWSPEVQYDWVLGIYQYIFGFAITYVGVVALEGTTLSLMSKVAPLKLRGSLISCGSIVTYLSLVGTVAGDVQILMVGLSHRLINTDIVNSLVIPLIAISLVAGVIVKKHFFFLI